MDTNRRGVIFFKHERRRKIKAAAAELNPDEQVELFRGWVGSDTLKPRQLAALKRDIAIGIEQLENGSLSNRPETTLGELRRNGYIATQ